MKIKIHHLKKYLPYGIIIVIFAGVFLYSILRQPVREVLQLREDEQAQQYVLNKKYSDIRIYKQSDVEEAKLVRSADTGDIYYINRLWRYIFPTENIFRTWFPDYDINIIPELTLDELYETNLSGNVFLRPSYLLQTETDPKVYFVNEQGVINEVTDTRLLEVIYDKDWEKEIVTLENKYFTNYTYGQAFDSLDDFPVIQANLLISQNQN